MSKENKIWKDREYQLVKAILSNPNTTIDGYNAYNTAHKFINNIRYKGEAVDESYLNYWYLRSINHNKYLLWTEDHIKELCNDFILIPKNENN